MDCDPPGKNKSPRGGLHGCVLWQALVFCFMVTEQKSLVLAQPVNNYWYRIIADFNLFPHCSLKQIQNKIHLYDCRVA